MVMRCGSVSAINQGIQGNDTNLIWSDNGVSSWIQISLTDTIEKGSCIYRKKSSLNQIKHDFTKFWEKREPKQVHEHISNVSRYQIWGIEENTEIFHEVICFSFRGIM